ncbi:polysaccharide pyruvyl transferase family protein [Prauserella muralis]|uniref:Polysaccharide pyruvyl transferase n=1 Tax=Prauserella muralis TaxID=588067 RepID=A0A2V4B4Q8_9PSEU|nr:polysaccharide pyruvyl transferase family protein [Prauserella muralis]PXY28358.1 polysaccharide pyruvyl transferase [Prauserella muralis]TWE22997.1 polysaccharide pyruvyl transferase [Prauserella muralis]
MRVLVTGWPSFLHGEATAGDVLSMRTVAAALDTAGVAFDTAWSPAFRPGALHLDDAEPAAYSHVVFACGPAHGEQLRWLHDRYASCRRIAVGVSVIDPADRAVTGFHRVLARDGDAVARADLALAASTTRVPVAGFVLAPGQHEYGERRRHEQVHEALLDWAGGLDCARVPLDTRLDSADWRHCATGDAFVSLVERLDVVVTTRLHGLVLALHAGVPALAVDPVAGGGKVSAQAHALDWPALVPAEQADAGRLGHWWNWCLSTRAGDAAAAPRRRVRPLDGALTALLDEVSR